MQLRKVAGEGEAQAAALILSRQAIVDLGVTRHWGFRRWPDSYISCDGRLPEPTGTPPAAGDRSVHASSNSGSSHIDGERYEFDQVGIGNRIRVRDGQGLAFLQETLS